MTWDRARQVRYAHHVLLPDVGGHGQDRITAARVAVVVDGRAGQLAALYLAAAGVGTVALVGGAASAPAAFPFGPAPVEPVTVALAAVIAARNPAVVVELAGPGPALAIADDRADLPLDAALARGGEAAARWLHACACAEAGP